jgi:ribose transport system substrate-binding protein
VAAARDAGIAVLGVDARIPVPPAHAFVGIDNHGASAKAGRDLVRLVDETLGGTARIGIVGAFNSLIQNERRDGFLEAVRTSSGIVIAGTVDSRNVQEQALAAAENLVTANQQLDFIYATGEPQDRTDRVRIIGWDLSPQAIRGLRQGSVHAVIQQDAYQQGYQAVVAALRLHRGEAVPEETFVPITIVTRENVDRFEHLSGR